MGCSCISGLDRSSAELFKMLPYIAAIVVLAAVSMGRSKEAQLPGA